MKTLVIANQKGGVGKSAVATLVAQHLVRHQRRVLAIDLDHQAYFTRAVQLSRRATLSTRTSDQLLESADGTPWPPDAFVLIAATDSLLGLERQAGLHAQFTSHLRDFLRSVADDFDVCVIDTPSSPDIRLVAALSVADAVLVPVQLNREALASLARLLDDSRCGIRSVDRGTKAAPAIGVLPSLVDSTGFQRDNLARLSRQHGALLIRDSLRPRRIASVPRRYAVAQAQGSGELMWEMKEPAHRQAWRAVEPAIASVAVFVNAAQVHP